MSDTPKLYGPDGVSVISTGMLNDPVRETLARLFGWVTGVAPPRDPEEAQVLLSNVTELIGLDYLKQRFPQVEITKLEGGPKNGGTRRGQFPRSA